MNLYVVGFLKTLTVQVSEKVYFIIFLNKILDERYYLISEN